MCILQVPHPCINNALIALALLIHKFGWNMTVKRYKFYAIIYVIDYPKLYYIV